MSDLRKAPIENEVDIQEQHAETAQETHKGFLAWVKVHKTQLILIGVSIPTIIAGVLGLKNKEAIKALWSQLNGGLKR